MLESWFKTRRVPEKCRRETALIMMVISGKIRRRSFFQTNCLSTYSYERFTIPFNSFPTLKNGSFFGRTSIFFPVLGFLPLYIVRLFSPVPGTPEILF